MIENSDLALVPDAIVRKHNVLIEARHSKLLDVRAMRLVAVAASLITDKDKDFKTYHIPVKEITNSPDVFGTVQVGEDKVMLIDKITDQLVQGVLKIPKKNADGTRTGESFTKYAYFSKCQYIKGSGYVEVEFHPDLKEFYLDLKGNYTQMSKQILRTIPGSYSFRLYELLKQYAQGKIFRREFLLKELYDMLAIKPHTTKKKSSYRSWSKFREKVILPAQKNFERHTDLVFDFTGWAKTGRAFTHIEFIMRKNKQFFQGDLFDQPKEDELIELIPQGIMDKIPPLQWEDKKIGCEQIVGEILDTQGLDALRFYIDYVEEQDRKTQIASWGKYIRSCWKNKLYENHIVNKAKTEKKKQAEQAQKQKADKAAAEQDAKTQEVKASITRLDGQVQSVLDSDKADQFISFVKDQVELNENKMMATRFKKNKPATVQEMYRRYIKQFQEEQGFPASDANDDSEYSIVDWLDNF